MTQEIAMMEAEAALARANKRSDWTWEVAYQQRGPEFSNMVSVGVAIPLQWDQKNRQDRELAAKLATAEKARAQRDEALRQHVAEVQSMLNEWENGRERLGRYQRELMPLARDRTQAVVSAYRGGKGDLMAVLAARRNEIDVRTQSLQLQMDTARVWAQLRYLYPDEAVSPAALSTTKANDLGRRP
jgi:outer membrane protein TolC